MLSTYCHKKNSFYFLLLIIIFLSSCSRLDKETATAYFPILQGITSENFTSFNIITVRDLGLRIKIFDRKSGKLLCSQGETCLDHKIIIKQYIADKEIHKIRFNYQLVSEPRNSHPSNFILKLTTKNHSEERYFKLKDLAKQHKIAISSCMNDHYQNEQKRIWTNLTKLNPDIIFMIGDNSYVDHGLKLKSGAEPQLLWQRYLETREKLHIFHSKTLIPIAMIWDDHDYGFNNGDKNYQYKNEASEVFQVFSQNYNPEHSSSGPGIAWSLIDKNRKFVFMDNRSFRDPDEDSSGSHFGEEQMQWLKSELEASPKQIYIISGDQFQGAYHPFESYQGNHPESYDQFISLLKGLSARTGKSGNSDSKKIKNITLISGDRHISEIQSIKEIPEITEITSSPIHSGLVPNKSLKNFPNPQRLWAFAGDHNFAILDTGAMQVSFYSLNSGLESIFKYRVTN